MIQTGCYRINVPEEGALLVVAWLLAHDMTEQAQDLVDAITPFFDRLRFYPRPDPNPIVPNPTVHRHTVGDTVEALQSRQPQRRVQQMIEALRVWQPLYDRAASLFLETVENDVPCRKYPVDWTTRAQTLLNEYTDLRKVHTLCRKPDRPKENFARLRGYMKTCIDDPSRLSQQDLSKIRHMLHCYVNRHGAPQSERFAHRRAEQARVASLPTHDELAEVLFSRLEKFPEDSGIGNFDAVISAVANDESLQFKVPEGFNIPESLLVKARRCWDAPIEQLIEKGVIPSGEVLAQVLPQITSQIRAAGITERDLRRLYAAIYSAFRRRRSLLLLHLERQVRFEDIPWIAALSSMRKDDFDTKEQARQSLEQVSTIAIASFPHAILPNKLLQEIRTLISAAGLSIPIVDELAADIFMGAFAEKFLRAAQIAAGMLRGTLYERYFGLPYERVLRMDDLQKTHAASVSPGFAALCEELAGTGKDERWSVSRNGKIIEQSQILTTQNLAPLFAALDLRASLLERLPELCQQCFRWICKRQMASAWKANLRMVKNSAYAWRQMLFFMSLLDAEAVSAFLLWARSYLEKQTDSRRQRLLPALSGLEWIVADGVFDQQGIGGRTGEGRRLLGWTTTRHWLLGPEGKDVPV
jgi:hypothetical protein